LDFQLINEEPRKTQKPVVDGVRIKGFKQDEGELFNEIFLKILDKNED